MSKQKRWIKSIIETSKTPAPALPWARGAGRAAFIAKRATPLKALKRA